MKGAARLARTQRLPSRPTAKTVCKAFDLELDRLLPAKHSGKHAFRLVYAARWCDTLTNHSLRAEQVSNAGEYNFTKTIGAVNPARAWLTQFLPSLLRRPRASPLLFELESPRYLALLHRRRHRGASAKAVAAYAFIVRCWRPAVYRAIGSLRIYRPSTLVRVGPWATPTVVARFRMPAHYLHQISLPSADQMRKARSAPKRIVAIVKSLTIEVGGTSFQSC